MESKGLGWNLGGKTRQCHTERWTILFAVVGSLALTASAARGQCPAAPCGSNDDCNDGLFCTVDTCVNPGATGNCFCVQRNCNESPDLFCTDDSCNETTDTCDHVPHTCSAPTPFCSESLDSCVACLQNSDCTVSPRLTCSSGVCVQCTNSSQCQDGQYCNGTESCNSTTGLCQAGTPPTCPKTCFQGTVPNGTTCTTDANCGTGGRCLGMCSNARAACVQCEMSATCDDGKYCNGAELCSKSGPTTDQCVVGTPPVCKKCVGGAQNLQPCSTNADCGNPPGPGTCTGGPSYCDEVSNQCVGCLNSSQCEDLNYCTTNNCIFNSCAYPSNPAICSDGLWCNGDEVCTWVLGNPCSQFNDRDHCCSSGTPRNCADSFSCTVDSCNETNDTCQNVANDGLCVDSLNCNGSETCQPGAPGASPTTGCKPGTPFDCTAQNSFCSVGTCTETPVVNCNRSPLNQGAACDDNSPCTALSKCNNGFCVDNPPAPNDPYRCVRLEWRPPTVSPVLAGSTIELGLYAVGVGCNTAHDSDKRCTNAAAGTLCTADSDCRVCVGGSNNGLLCTSAANCPSGSCPAVPAGTCTDYCPSTAMPLTSVDALFSWNKTFLELNPTSGPNPNPQESCVAPTTCLGCPINTYAWSGSGGSALWINDCTITGGDGLNAPCTPGQVPGNDGNARFLALRGIDVNCPDGCATAAGLKVATIKFKAISGGTSQIAFIPCFGEHSKTQAQSPLVVEGVLTSDVTKSLGPPVTITVTCDSHDDCNDNNVCTNDSCSCTTPSCGGTCSRVNNTNSCNDGLFCTKNDRCSGGVCIGDPTCKKCVGGPDNGEPCSIDSQCGVPGTCTGASSICQETNDRCVECTTAANCNDGIGNTTDTCVKTCSGGDNLNEICQDISDCPGTGGACESDYCVHTPIDCNDNVACTIDVSDPVDGHCSNTPDHAFCNPLNAFCSSAVVCDAEQGCVFECISDANGNPCPDPATCIESTDSCGGCFEPTVTTAGCRYLNVTPAAQGSTPVALLVTGDCGDPNIACVYRYVQSKCNGGSNNGLNCNTDADCPKTCVGGPSAGMSCTSLANCPLGTACSGFCDAGTLGPTPYYKLSSQWGTAKVRGAQVRPGSTYTVHTECNIGGGPVLSSNASATTWRWGETDGNGVLNALDISAVVSRFKNSPGAIPFEQANVWACTPDFNIDALDIVNVVDAFKGFAFSCVISCP